MPKIVFKGSYSRRAWAATIRAGSVALIVCLGFFVGCSSRPTDEAVENGIKAKMFSDAQLKESNVTVTAHDGTVTLSGEVPSDAARAEANQIAKAQRGVTQVNDQLTVAGPAAGIPPAASPLPGSAAAPARARGKNTEASVAAYKIIPSGTEITVRTNETIDSKAAAPGQTYSATIAADILDASGDVAVPRGSEAQLVILKSASGRVTTQSDLVLDLDSVTVAGRRYVVTTAPVEQKGHQGLGKNRRTLEMTGGGAALGALVGAIAGKGKGAAIGAAVGAAGGAGAQVLTKGSEVRVPAESVLKFRLEKNLKLAGTR